MRQKPYVGCLKSGKKEVFTAETKPTTDSHGHIYFAVIGPFRTMRGAKYMADGGDNPHCLTVYDAERLAKCLSKKV